MKTIKNILLTLLFVVAVSLAFTKLNCFAQDNYEYQDENYISNTQTELTHTDNQSIQIAETEYIHGKIIEILEEKEIEFQGLKQKYQKLKILVTKGILKDEEIVVENGAGSLVQAIEYHKGDRVIISYTKGIEGNDVFYITDFIRTNEILTLFIIFVIISLAIGTKKGLYSLLSMVISFIIIFVFVLPQIQAGKDPVFIAILSSIVIIPITFYMSHGFNKKTTISMMGTFIAVIITGLLANFFVNLTHLSGTASEESMFLQLSNGIQYNLKGLLLAGIIIGTLGVMDDITVSQTAIVYQLYDLRNDLPFSDLFKRSIQIGKEHISSMINTLILVYTGASMPLLLLFMNNPRPFEEILNFELISTEIVRTLVGSIGLILAVPITTYLACHFVKRKS